MLSHYDESLMHQVGQTFDHAGVSDHRFFDRVWVGGHCADNVKVISGMAAYKNTNAFDGFFCVMKDGKQYNVRTTRRFRPHLGHAAVGPISYEVIKPFEKVRMLLAATEQSPISGDVVFTASIPPIEEDRHYSRVNGAILQDYVRFNQIGRLDGHLIIAGQRIEVSNWFGGRDHSWGTRLRMGGYDPDTFGPGANTSPGDPARGNIWLWLGFTAGEYAGQMQRVEDGNGRLQLLSGHVFKTGDERVYQVVSVEYDADFLTDTRVYRGLQVRAVLDSGETLHIEARALLAPWCYKGAGYDNGFDDEFGLGRCRGDRVEADIYDVSDPELVVLPDGRRIRPGHREQPVTITVNGISGLAHLPLINRGVIARYGLERAPTNLRPSSE